MTSRKVSLWMAVCLCVALSVGGARAVLAYGIAVDGDAADWMADPPPADNLGHIWRDATPKGEYVWRDPAADELTVFGSDDRVDLLEFRVTSDPERLYFMVRMQDIDLAAGDGAPQVRVAVDSDQLNLSGRVNMGSDSDLQVAPDAAWEHMLVTRFGSDNQDLIVWQGALSTTVGTAAISTTSDCIEFSVLWTDLGMPAPPQRPLRFSVATFRSDVNDQSLDVAASSDALDLISNYGDPGSANATGDETADGVLDYYFDVFFAAAGDVYAPLLISEVLYDPSALEPAAEFIELYNATALTLDLSDYKVGDEETIDGGVGDGMEGFGSGMLAPATPLVLANDAAVFLATYGFLPDYAINASGELVSETLGYGLWTTGDVNLSNSGDDILVLDGSDTVIDVIEYSDSFPEWSGLLNTDIETSEGESLERAPADWDTNDMAKDFVIRSQEGTPGQASRRVTQVLPAANSHVAALDTRLEITFNAPLSATSVTPEQVFAYGAFQGRVHGAVDAQMVFTPALSFYPGEVVQAGVLSSLVADGLPLGAPHVWQFRTAVQEGTGVFVDSRQRLGLADSRDVLLGDLDGDADLDALVVNQDAANKVWLNSGGGGFAATVQELGDAWSRGAALGDLDQDGDLDAWVANHGELPDGGPNFVWLNDGDGFFADSAQRLGAAHSEAVALGDLDGDGDLDAFVANWGGDPSAVWFNAGGLQGGAAGQFIDSAQALGGGVSRDVALADVDSDGDLDALLANDGVASALWRNDGHGHFSQAQDLADANSQGLALGDFNADGYVDVFIANLGQANSVWFNLGNGTLVDSGQALGASDSNAVTLGDLNADGALDAFVVNAGSPNRVWINDGSGHFSDLAQTFDPATSSAAALGDLDADGDLDAFVANHSAEANTVWLNQNQAALSIFKTVDPAVVRVGDPLTYTLNFFNSGTLTATDVTITDTLPAELLITGVQTSGVAIVDSGTLPPYVWDVQDLDPGQGGVITINATLQGNFAAGALLTNTATLGGLVDARWITHSSSAVLVTPYADLQVTKEAAPEPVVAGETLFYTITVANLGPDAAEGVLISDTLDPWTNLLPVDQVDDDYDVFGFGGGTYQDTYWNDPRPGVSNDEWLQLVDTITPTGIFTSRIIDAYNPVAWERLDWTPERPYGKALPDNNGVETVYYQGDANMTNNRVLFHFDDVPAATIFTDTSGSDLHGICPAMAGEVCPTSGAAGHFNTALSFDGISSTVAISDVLNPSRYAIELWVRPNLLTDTSFILRSDTFSDAIGSYSHMLGIVGGRFVHYANDGQPRVALGSTMVQTDTWYHLVGTAESGGDIKLYVNGRQEAKVDGIGALWNGGQAYRLGAPYDTLTTTHYFSGTLDEVAIYSRTLSAGEISDHYLRGALDLVFEVRSCDDPLCVGDAFLPETYSAALNDGLGRPAIALNAVPENRYFQYRATLRTAEAAYGPRLRRVQVSPAHWQVTSSQGACVIPNSQFFSCTLGTLDAGAWATLTLEVALDPSAIGVITNTVFVTQTAPGDARPLNNTAYATSTVTTRSQLVIGKYDEEDPVSPGTVITYGLNVHNYGPSDALSVTVTDTLPSGIIGHAWGGTPAGWVCESGNTITCTLPSLSVGYHWSAIMITATAPLTEGVIMNTAWVTTSLTEVYTTTSISDTETTQIIPLADLVIDKSAHPDPVLPGGTLTYTLVVTNSGPYTATGVVVTDTLDSGMIGYPIAGDWLCGVPADVLVCELPTELVPGAASSFEITVTAPLSGLLTNYAFVISDILDPQMENNEVLVYSAVLPVADLSVAKYDTPDPVFAADLLTYTVVVTNNGPMPAGVVTRELTLQNPNRINLPWAGRAQPYPANIYLSSVEGLMRSITVTLEGLSHTYPGDLSALLVGPGGQSVVLMSNAGGGADADDLTLTFADAGVPMPLSGTLTSTLAYRPTNYGIVGDLPDPAPEGPYGGTLGTFLGTSPNGVWQLYLYDMVDSDGGALADGWSLAFTTVTTDSVLLTDAWPDTLTDVVWASPAGWDCDSSGNPFFCSSDYFAAHESAVFTLTATAPITGSVISNTASITSTMADLDLTQNVVEITTTVMPISDLAIEKQVQPSVATANEALTYTLVISSSGPSPIGTTVLVTDVLPAGLTDISVQADPWSCDLSAAPLLTCTLDTLTLGTAPLIQIHANAPLTSGVIFNSAGITATVADSDLANNSDWITTTVLVQPIAGLQAFNDSPTVINDITELWATMSAGTDVTFAWDFGDGFGGVGTPLTHSYTLSGTYTAVVTATNTRNTMTATTEVVIFPLYKIYLPQVMNRYVMGADLVVESLLASGNAVTVTIRNQGHDKIEALPDNEFWVDVYIDPQTPPSTVNQKWWELGDQGLAWGVTVTALPLQPNALLTLTLESPYFRADQSQVTWTLPISTPFWAQVDSVNNPDVDYGAVLETHEILGSDYNNIMGPVEYAGSTVQSQVRLPLILKRERTSWGNLPPR